MKEKFDILEYNREAWNKYSEEGISPWVIPISSDELKKAREGDVRIFLTPTKIVPKKWFPPLKGCKVLCLASGGGQQAPLLSAAGADVTTFDNSDRQLQADIDTCRVYGLPLNAERGDMRDLSRFASGSFDLIIHPVSNLFIDDVRIVWKEAYRVLRKGGRMLAGFNNPIIYLFNGIKMERGELEVAHILPYSPFNEDAKQETERWMKDGDALEWGHSLEDQIGGQTDAGFAIVGMYEDTNRKDSAMALDRYTSVYIATAAVKL